MNSHGFGLRAAQRQQKLQTKKRLFVSATLAIACIFLGFSAYKLGVYQTEHHFQEMRTLFENSSDTLESYKKKVEDLDHQTELAKAESKTWQERYEREVPTGPGKGLYDIVVQRLEEGIQPERLSFVLRNTQHTSKCSEKPIIKKVPIGLEGSPHLEAISFFDGTVFVQGEGKPAKNSKGSKETWFDSQNSVSVTLSHVSGKTHLATGKLPFQTILQVNDKAYHFHLRTGTKGYCFISASLCDYP